MEIRERVRHLRKNYLKMSQTEFGEKLGVNRSVINNIENNRLVKPEQKAPLFKLICKEFGVREEWLFNEIEPIFVNPEDSSINLSASSTLSDLRLVDFEFALLKAYFSVDPETRRSFATQFVPKLIEGLNNGADVPKEK